MSKLCILAARDMEISIWLNENLNTMDVYNVSPSLQYCIHSIQHTRAHQSRHRTVVLMMLLLLPLPLLLLLQQTAGLGVNKLDSK